MKIRNRILSFCFKFVCQIVFKNDRFNYIQIVISPLGNSVFMFCFYVPNTGDRKYPFTLSFFLSYDLFNFTPHIVKLIEKNKTKQIVTVIIR